MNIGLVFEMEFARLRECIRQHCRPFQQQIADFFENVDAERFLDHLIFKFLFANKTSRDVS